MPRIIPTSLQSCRMSMWLPGAQIPNQPNLRRSRSFFPSLIFHIFFLSSIVVLSLEFFLSSMESLPLPWRPKRTFRNQIRKTNEKKKKKRKNESEVKDPFVSFPSTMNFLNNSEERRKNWGKIMWRLMGQKESTFTPYGEAFASLERSNRRSWPVHLDQSSTSLWAMK